MEEVPRRTSLAPLASPCYLLGLMGVETEGLLDYQGRAVIIPIARWNLEPPVIFGVENPATTTVKAAAAAAAAAKRRSQENSEELTLAKR